MILSWQADVCQAGAAKPFAAVGRLRKLRWFWWFGITTRLTVAMFDVLFRSI